MGIDPFVSAESVDLEEMLDARERRACTQQELLRKYKMSLVCFTLNIPGKYKTYPLVQEAFAEGKQVIERLFQKNSVTIVYTVSSVAKTGCEAFYCVDYPADHLKQTMLTAEEYHPLGRLFDIDVFNRDGVSLHGEQYGRKERPCLICGNPVWECSRNRVTQQMSSRCTLSGICGTIF